jgi:DNA-binding SARP family transcriptional activator
MTPAGRPVPFRTRKALGLLVFLAAEPRPHPRDSLADLLWSRAAPAEARHSLANAISEVRRRLGKSAVETIGDRVRLRTDLVTLDLQRLASGDVLGNEVDGPLEVDGFLEGFDLPDAVGFAHWKEGQRAGLVPHIRDALVTLLDRARRTGNFPELGRLGDRLARFDELSEDAVRARMESRAFAGDRMGSLRLFEQWKMELADQMGAVPSELLEGMSLRLRRRGWERPGSVDIPAVRMDQWRDRPFVGRAEEYRQLYEAWEATLRGEPRHRLLLGDSGVGKSTLVDRIGAVAALEGATVARTQCHELEHELPYAAVSELIVQLVDRPGATATPPEQLAELAQHIPAVRRRFVNLPEPLATQGEASRVRFSEATHALMHAVAEEHPLIIVVDDMHNCDDVSLAVLHYVLRHSRDRHLLMVFLARPGELRRSENARKLLEHGAAVGIATLQIRPLGEEDTTSLLEGLLREESQDLSIVSRRALVGASGGIPLVLELLLRDWRQSGDSTLALQLDAITPTPGRHEAATETYHLVLDRLFGGLEGDTRMVLYTAAILGRHLNEPGMYALADLTASQMMYGLGRLTELRVLRDGGTGLEFANDLVRGQAYMSVPLSLRRLLHGRVADELIERATRGESDHGLDIAWHCMRSGRTEESMEYLLEGASSARRRGATHEAEFRLSSALSQFKGVKRTAAVLTLTELVQEQNRWEDSLKVLMGDTDALTSTLGQIYLRTANTGLNRMLPSEFVETIELIRGVVTSRPVDLRAALAAVELAVLIYSQAYDDELLPTLMTLIQESESIDWPPEERATVALARMKLQFNLGMTRDQRMEAIDQLKGLAELTSAFDTPSRRSCSLVAGIGILVTTLGDIPESMEFIEAAILLAQRLDNSRHIVGSHANLCVRHGWTGNYQKQREHAAMVINGPLAGAASIYNSITATFEYALASAMLGDHAAARRAMEAQRFRVPSTATNALQQTWMLLQADIYCILRDEHTAAQLGLDALTLSDGRVMAMRTTAGTASRAAFRALQCMTSGEELQARQLLAQLASERARLDATEAAEVLSTFVLTSEHSHERTVAIQDLGEILSRLPPAAALRLEALGTPPPPECRRVD